MFLECFLSILCSQLILVGVAFAAIYFVGKFNKKRENRNYDEDYLYNASMSTLIEMYLQNRFPKSISDKTVPIPDGESIPAPMYHDQNCIPMTPHEFNMRTEAIKKFLIARYGNIRNFHDEVVETFSDDQEVETEDIKDNDDEYSSESVYEELVDVVKVSKKEPGPVKDSPKGGQQKEEPAKEQPVKEQPKEPVKEQPAKEQPKERVVKPKPKKVESDSESESSIIVEKQAPASESESESDSEAFNKKMKKTLDDDDDFINQLIETNGVKKAKSSKGHKK